MKNKWLIIILIVTCAVFMGLKLQIEQIPRKKLPGSSIIYLPSGKYLKYATFGYSTLMADLIYLWAIQYFSTPTIPNRYQYLDHIFSIIAELDPHYLDPYELGAIIAVYEAKDLELAYTILDRGLKKNPDQWIFPFQAGHYAQMIEKNYERARKYYKKTMNIEGAPPLARRLYAHAAYKMSDYQTSWNHWLEIYKQAETERIKKIASNHLYRVKATRDIQRIEKALENFNSHYGHYPQSLEKLVQTGYLDSVPKDLDGESYVYDPETGQVKSPTIPWKR